VDYVLPAIQHQRPVAAELEVVRLQEERPFAICVEASLRPFYVSPMASACTKTLYVQDL
jgi:hypothetical protein